MKPKKQLSTVLIILSCTFIFAQQAQQKIDMAIDALGNAKLNISMTMNASQWQTWNANYGNNPASLKRDMERAMPAYFLDDFKLEKDDMNRSFNLSLNAYGVCEIDKRGRWIVDTDQKNAQLTELTKHKYMLVSSPPEFGGTIQQTYTIEFPKEAKDIKTDTDAFGKSIFKFEMNNPSPINIMRWSGIILLVIGGAWTGKTLIKNNSN